MSEKRYPYHINIFFDPEDGDYIVDVPDFKYVSAFGDTIKSQSFCKNRKAA